MSSVIIKADAYYKMLLHVLRFGNKARDRRQFKEVMGILIGRLEGEPDKKGIRDVIIEDAVPISHGGAIEVAFAPEDYVTFSMVDAAYAEKNWFSCGWYHSHPGLDIFFSSTDIKNQLGWQTPNPSAVGIVFDHTHLERPGNLGFRTFRLDNPAKGQMSEYHEVKSIIEPPDSIEYYVKLMELINCIHSKEPPILEINEMPDLFGDLTFPSESQIL
ncbi:MAG: Mov34/MPN/PAD-1 family protein, partial [Promethearchaeota archaeon]